MKKERDNGNGFSRDSIAGYLIIVLGIVCFLLFLIVLTAVVRLVVGLGASAAAGAVAAGTTGVGA